MSPLEFLLFLTFLVYSFYYKLALFVIYVLLIIAYFIYCVRSFSQVKGIDAKKQKIMASTFSGPDYSCYNLTYEFDVTESIEYAKKLSKQQEIPITITHIALRAIIMGVSKSKDILGALKWGNFQSDEQVRITTVADVEKGKDLVPLHLRDSMNDGVVEIARKMKTMVEMARNRKDKVHKKRYEALFLPTFIIRFITAVNSYAINRLDFTPDKQAFKPKDFGNALVSNVGVFGMKRGFAPLLEFSGGCVMIAMGKVEKRPVVRDNKIVVRSIMNFNFAYDVRYSALQSLYPCYEQVRNHLILVEGMLLRS